ncbi:hypothetical protein B0O99DRAFT_213424 [Bisporella sp. PMI_857]|nr:hypothetical protein B0O99DRAFT_213424 [Bisporella sp. PMI_857]
MASRYIYTPEELKHLASSPLVVKPPGLPPTEQWMGASVDSTRNNSTKITDRAKRSDSDLLLDQTNRRPQHISRNSNPAEIILGPPKTSFLSATPNRNVGKSFDSPDRPPLRDAENSKDRFSFRNKTGEADDERGHRPLLRSKRTEGEADAENGWEKVKPRKSFGAEGVERFNGRMGGIDRHRDDRRFRDREERDVRDRPQRGFDTFLRDKDGDHDQDREPRRNGTGRGRGESWRDNDAPPTPRDRNSNGDRLVDRSRGWREKERDDRGDQDRERGDRGGGRNDRGDRRWERNRDDRQEREPEWLDDPADAKVEVHTQEDFQKWKDSMRKDNSAGGKTPAEDVNMSADAGAAFFGLEKPKVETPLAIDTGPDSFFGKWGTPREEKAPDSGIEARKEGIAKAKSGGKASRFTSFFTPQEEIPRRQTEPPVPMPEAPSNNALAALFQPPSTSQPPNEERAQFQQMLEKLRRQNLNGTGTTPPANPQQQPKPPIQPSLEPQHSHPPLASDTFQQYRPDRQEERPSAGTRNSQHALQDLLSQRQGAGSQPSIRPEQMLQDLVGQRQNALSQASQRPEQSQSRSNSEFLMNLMRNAPEQQRAEQNIQRMPPQNPAERQVPSERQLRDQLMLEQELHREAARERNNTQRQGRAQAPPGFFDEPSFQRGPTIQHERHGNPPQPTQILQRPPPPGLNQMQPGWAQSPSELGPQQQIRQQHIAPPPGLAAGPNRGMPMPQMFPPGFQGMGSFPPPSDARMQPPLGFFNAPPPPGFMPQGMGGFPGPDGMAYGGQFDGRGPPPSAFRRPQ